MKMIYVIDIGLLIVSQYNPMGASVEKVNDLK